MRPVITFIICFVLSTCYALAQFVEGPFSILDYRYLQPTQQVLHHRHLYTSYIYPNGVMRFDSTIDSPFPVNQLSKIVVARLFSANNVLFAASVSGELYYLNEAISEWLLIDTYRGLPFVDLDRVYVLAGESIMEIAYDGATWQEATVATLPVGDAKVSMFVTVGDTAVYALEGSPEISIVSFDGTVKRTVRSHSPVDGLFLLEDESIAISANSRTGQLLKSGTLSTGEIEYLHFQKSQLSLSNATPISSSVGRGVTGVFQVFGIDPRQGVYRVFTPDSVVKITNLDGIVDKAQLASFQYGQWILSSDSKIAIVSKDSLVALRSWHRDTIIQLSTGVSFTGNGLPFRCGGAIVEGQLYPAMLPTSASEPIRIVDAQQNTDHQLVRYIQLKDGPEVAFCRNIIFTKGANTLWDTAFVSPWSIYSNSVSVVNDSVIVCRLYGGRLLISLNKGESWKSVAIKDFSTRVSSVVSSGTTLFAQCQGILSAVDLTDLSDSLVPPSTNITLAPHRQLFSCTPSVVQFATLKSDSDPKYNPDYYTHVMCQKWNSITGWIDSTTHRLTTFLPSGGVTIIARHDTAFIWDHQLRRLISVTYEGINYDTTFPVAEGEAQASRILPNFITDNSGNFWLVANGELAGFKLQPGKGSVSSVHDYYNYLYVSSVCPNPATDNVKVTLGRFPAAIDADMRFYLVDLNGSLVRTYTHLLSSFPGPTSTQDIEISVEGLAHGVYLLVIENRQGKHVGKIVVGS